MNKILFEKLKDWQTKTARKEGVEPFRVLPYRSIEEIAKREPRTKEELLEVKGIKEKKFARYGEEILAMVQGETEDLVEEAEKKEKIYEVSEYLDWLNENLLDFEARVKGEVSSIDKRGNYVFFGIKDKKGESLINCFMWQSDYGISGVSLEEGMEIVVWGHPSVFKPSGRLSFQTKLIELVGEGVLKKAYDELKAKLEKEGLFALERKKPIPKFSHKIGLITSHLGAAIGDFTSNLGSYGFKVKFCDSRVEGKQAVFDLIEAVRWFNRNMPDLDVLVVVRGGGSLESLQAFNTESLVREIAGSKIPILCGVGHEKDTPLTALAADKMVSTPTAAAIEITKEWDGATYKVDQMEQQLLSNLARMLERFEQAKQALHREFEKIGQAIKYNCGRLKDFSKNIFSVFRRWITVVEEKVEIAESKLKLNNPERQLRLGYSLVSLGGRIIRSVKSVKVGDDINIKVSDGDIRSKIAEIKPGI